MLLGAGLIGDRRVDLPDYIHNNRYVVGMDKEMSEWLRATYVSFRCFPMRLNCPCDLSNTKEVSRRQRVQRVEDRRMLRLYKKVMRYTRQEVSASDFGEV